MLALVLQESRNATGGESNWQTQADRMQLRVARRVDSNLVESRAWAAQFPQLYYVLVATMQAAGG